MNDEAFVKVDGQEFSTLALNIHASLLVENQQKLDAFDEILDKRFTEAKQKYADAYAKTLDYYRSGKWKEDLMQQLEPFKFKTVERIGFLWIKPIYKDTVDWNGVRNSIHQIVKPLMEIDSLFWSARFYAEEHYLYREYGRKWVELIVSIYNGETFDESYPDEPKPPSSHVTSRWDYLLPVTFTTKHAEVQMSGYNVVIGKDEEPDLHSIHVLPKFFNLQGNDCFVPIKEYNHIMELKVSADKFDAKDVSQSQ